MHAEAADENATLHDKVAVLEARDTSRIHIEDLYAKLVASGILDLEEEEEVMANRRGEDDGETGPEEDSDADMASDPVSEAEEADEAGGEDENGSAPLDQVNGELSAEPPTAGSRGTPG